MNKKQIQALLAVCKLPIVGVMGSGRERHEELAGRLGRCLANLSVHLLTGGGHGVMATVSRAFAEVKDRKGLILGILSCRGVNDTRPRVGYPNRWVEIPIATHLPLSGRRGCEPMSRNHINILTANPIIVLPGGFGTASELSLAIQYKKPVLAYLGECGIIKGSEGIQDYERVPRASTIEEVEEFLNTTLNQN